MNAVQPVAAKSGRTLVIEGEPDYGKDEEHEWPRAWYGVKGYFRWLESKAYKMHVRVLLSRYRAYTTCPDCHGQRFQPEALLYRAIGKPRPKTEGRNRRPKTRSEGESGQSLTSAPYEWLDARRFLPACRFATPCRSSNNSPNAHRFDPNDPLGLVLNEVRSRLGYLDEVGLGYLTLDRPTRTLSGGETERVNLTTCLGTRLVNTLFVLDEPSVGLHPRDTDRLVRILEKLRDTGNTVVVVEHEASVMRAADQIVDLGPGHGATGGEVVFQGSYKEILKSKTSLTGQYLSGRKQIEIPNGRSKQPASRLSHHSQRRPISDPLVLNDAHSPCKTGGTPVPLSSSPTPRGTTSRTSPSKFRSTASCASPASAAPAKPRSSAKFCCRRLADRLKSPNLNPPSKPPTGSPPKTQQRRRSQRFRTPHSALRNLQGSEHLSRVVLVDQSILGKTPRSNPAVYIGAFDDIREVFAQSEVAKQRGLNASAFSFNSGQGQCERCRGAGFEKIEMQFLSDVFIRCPDCNGRRYRPHILEVKIAIQSPNQVKVQSPKSKSARTRITHHAPRITHHVPPFSIADLLEATVEEAIAFLSGFPESRPAERAVESLKLLQEVGLGYLRLGQPINTLSGGESQRLKLVRHLAEAMVAAEAESRLKPNSERNPNSQSPPQRLGCSRSSSSTSPPPACTSMTCACCSKFSNASWTPATPSSSSNTTST